MMSGNPKVQVEIEEIVQHANNTSNRDARNQIVQGEVGNKPRNRERNKDSTPAGKEDEIQVPMMHAACGALEHKPTRNEIVQRDRNQEAKCSRNLIRNEEEFRHEPNQQEIKRKRRPAHERVLQESLKRTTS